MNQIIEKKRSLAEIIAEKKQRELDQQFNHHMEMQDKRELPINEGTESFIASFSVPPMNPSTPLNPLLIKKLSFKEIIEAKKKAEGQVPETSLLSPIEPKDAAKYYANLPAMIQEGEEEKELPYSGAFSLSIHLNKEQLLAKEMAFAGKSFCLIGAAGTGKTTAQREIAAELLKSNCLYTHDFRIQGTGERISAPSIAFVAYTRIASANLRRAIHKDPDLEAALTHNVTTIHNLLEYQPETYWDYDDNKEKFRFIPKRDRSNPLDITHLVIEESSMVGLDLWEKLFDALREGVQIIFIGDINQLPPVFGDSILNYALVQLPVVELTHVYRQAGDSTILKNAHSILSGGTLTEAEDFKIVRCGIVSHTQGKLAATLGMTFPKWAKIGEYDPLTDIILSPWNKRDLGTDNMNKWIAQFLGTERNAVVHEIVAGMTKVYLAVGDKVMYNKQVGVIERITLNGRYMGRSPLPCSNNLNRFGTYTGGEEETMEDLDSMDYSNLNLDSMMEDDKGDRTKEASHLVDIILDSGETATLTSVGDFAPATFSLAYCLTVHKAQGCEWRKVYLILHRDHAISLCREALYTAVTRAREQMVIIAKEEVINKAISIQRIKGNNVKEKIEYFNSGISLNNAVKCTK